MRHASEWTAFACVGLMLCWCSTAAAAVQSIDATSAADVTQTLSGSVVNTDSSFQSLNETTSNLPLIAKARLDQLDSGQATASAANDKRLAMLMAGPLPKLTWCARKTIPVFSTLRKELPAFAALSRQRLRHLFDAGFHNDDIMRSIGPPVRLA